MTYVFGMVAYVVYWRVQGLRTSWYVIGELVTVRRREGTYEIVLGICVVIALSDTDRRTYSAFAGICATYT